MNKAKVISFYNNKGGVGKTTLLINIAQSIFNLTNDKILVIDNDPQSNCTMILTDLHEDELASMNTSYELLTDDNISARDCIIKSRFNGIDLIPATIDHSDTPDVISSRIDNTRILNRKIKDILNDYKYIFIDNSPSVDRNVYNALFSSDVVLSPVETQLFSKIGINNLLKQVGKINRIKDSYLNHYVFINKIDNRKKVLNASVKKELKSFLLDDFIDSPISLLSSYSKSIDNRQSIFDFGDEKGIQEVNKLTKHILKVIEEED